MAKVAAIAAKARDALLASSESDSDRIARSRTLVTLMNENFDLRRAMFGDEALGARNIDMVMTPRRFGAGSKFTGSGGAAVVMCPDGNDQWETVKEACEAKGFKTARVVLNPAPCAA